MKRAIGSDHAGFPLKEKIRAYFEEKGIEYVDCGVYEIASADYPVQAKLTCEKIVSGECVRGILCCGTGIGISMAANKVKGIRAALCHDVFSAEATRLHNDANILAMGGRIVGPGLALMIVDKFLDTPFSNEERHARRISMMED